MSYNFTMMNLFVDPVMSFINQIEGEVLFNFSNDNLTSYTNEACTIVSLRPFQVIVSF